MSRGVTYWQVPITRCLIIVDDVNLPFGHFRFREKGSSGGHNGLKSIEQKFGTNEYPRLRIGVGCNGNEDLADYVLSPFTKEEKKKLPDIEQYARKLVKVWLKEQEIPQGSLKLED